MKNEYLHAAAVVAGTLALVLSLGESGHLLAYAQTGPDWEVPVGVMQALGRAPQVQLLVVFGMGATLYGLWRRASWWSTAAALALSIVAIKAALALNDNPMQWPTHWPSRSEEVRSWPVTLPLFGMALAVPILCQPVVTVLRRRRGAQVSAPLPSSTKRFYELLGAAWIIFTSACSALLILAFVAPSKSGLQAAMYAVAGLALAAGVFAAAAEKRAAAYLNTVPYAVIILLCLEELLLELVTHVMLSVLLCSLPLLAVNVFYYRSKHLPTPS